MMGDKRETLALYGLIKQTKKIAAKAGPDNLCESRSLAGTRMRVEDPDLSGVVWGLGEENPRLPDWMNVFNSDFYLFSSSIFKE